MFVVGVRLDGVCCWICTVRCRNQENDRESLPVWKRGIFPDLNDRFVRTVTHIANTWDQDAACIVLCKGMSVTDYDKNTVGSFVSPKSAKLISPDF